MLARKDLDRSVSVPGAKIPRNDSILQESITHIWRQ